MKRCLWAEAGDEASKKYHDLEWGVPVTEDNKLFEFIVLESAQAGLSWKTILNKREGYRKLFKDFDPNKVAKLSDREVVELLQDPSIVRNKLKILATISNAEAFIRIQNEFGSFANYMWRYVNYQPINSKYKSGTEVPTTTELAITMAKDLKKRGFKFLGPTIWYAHMQAVGMVNDHSTDCFRHKEINQLPRTSLSK